MLTTMMEEDWTIALKVFEALGEVYQHHRPLLPVDQDTTPAVLSPLRRQNPKEETGALVSVREHS